MVSDLVEHFALIQGLEGDPHCKDRSRLVDVKIYNFLVGLQDGYAGLP